MDPRAFRDGIFSQAAPLSKYGVLLTSYSDGSLGASGSSLLARPVQADAKPGLPIADQSTAAQQAYQEDTKARLGSSAWWIAGLGILVVGAAGYLVLRRKS